VRNAGASVAVLIAIAALLAATWLLRAQALIVGESAAQSHDKIQECAQRLCLTGQPAAPRYRYAIPGGALTVTLRSVGSRARVITIRAKPAHRKADLFGKLIAKQYRGPLPHIRIRMR